LANAVMQAQPDGGSIINISSVSAHRPSPGTAAYGAAKAGVDSLTASLAVEWAPKVRVNSVVVGPVETELSLLHDGDADGVTGAGRGIGRAHALAFAAAGAKVVVNDLGSALNGADTGETPAEQVVAEIRAQGGEAVANGDDVADWEGARRLIRQAIDTFGGLDVLVNTAG